MILSDVVPPPVRPLEVQSVETREQGMAFVLRDNLRVAPQPLIVSPPGYFLLVHFDGERTYEQIAAIFEQQFRQPLPLEELARLHQALDAALLLANERFMGALNERRQAYSDGDARDNRDRWPTADELRGEIAGMFAPLVSPPISGAPAAALRGIIAPHLDYARGEPCYAAAYELLRAAGPVDRYVILGVNHYGIARGVITTRKDFQTPLGRARVDGPFLDALDAALGANLAEHEFDHAAEHSVELQVHVLQTLFPDHPFTIVPVLCPDPSAPSVGDEEGPSIDDFADELGALTRTAAGRTILIAGADLSHIGQRFGDEQPTTAELMFNVGAFDRSLLSLLEQRRDQNFVAEIRARENQTRICSVGNIYALLRALPGASCRILRYHQASDFPAETHVTCAAAAICDSASGSDEQARVL